MRFLKLLALVVVGGFLLGQGARHPATSSSTTALAGQQWLHYAARDNGAAVANECMQAGRSNGNMQASSATNATYPVPASGTIVELVCAINSSSGWDSGDEFALELRDESDTLIAGTGFSWTDSEITTAASGPSNITETFNVALSGEVGIMVCIDTVTQDTGADADFHISCLLKLSD